MKRDVRNLRERFVCPTARPMAGIDRKVLDKFLEVAWDYSMNGIESVRCGHILACGAIDLQRHGTVKGDRGKSWSLYDANIKNENHRADLMKEMNQDGAHVVLPDGRIIAGSFYANKVDTSCSGGSGHGAASMLSRIPGSVVIKISADGSITEFRDGKPLKLCGNRSVNTLGSPTKPKASKFRFNADSPLPHRWIKSAPAAIEIVPFAEMSRYIKGRAPQKPTVDSDAVAEQPLVDEQLPRQQLEARRKVDTQEFDAKMRIQFDVQARALPPNLVARIPDEQCDLLLIDEKEDLAHRLPRQQRSQLFHDRSHSNYYLSETLERSHGAKMPAQSPGVTSLLAGCKVPCTGGNAPISDAASQSSLGIVACDPCFHMWSGTSKQAHFKFACGRHLDRAGSAFGIGGDRTREGHQCQWKQRQLQSLQCRRSQQVHGDGVHSRLSSVLL